MRRSKVSALHFENPTRPFPGLVSGFFPFALKKSGQWYVQARTVRERSTYADRERSFLEFKFRQLDWRS